MNLGDLNGILGGLVGFILTLMIFSYMLGDNFMFRLAVHIFIGVAAGYILMVVWNSVIWMHLVDPLRTGEPVEALLALVPLALSAALLLGKANNRLAWLRRPVLAFLVGVGAATAVGGAVLGTLFPQVSAATNLLSLKAIDTQGISRGEGLLNGLVILVGTVSTLAYFQFGVRNVAGQSQRPAWLQVTAWVGQFFIAIALGSIFAGVYAAALTALVERLNAIVLLIIHLLSTPV
jgi:hypothetical protein